MYKAAIFDLDGTLADTIESIAAACNKTLRECGLMEIETERYKYYAGDGADTLIVRALKAAGDTGLEHYDRAYREYKRFFELDCTYKVTVFDGMKETLDRMKEQGIKLAVVTNKPHDRAVTVVEYLFGAGYFDYILGEGRGFPKKPDPAGVLSAAAVLGAGAKECIYVGDTNVDMQTGKGAGMFTVGVLWGFRTKEELEENHADAVIGHPRELLQLL